VGACQACGWVDGLVRACNVIERGREARGKSAEISRQANEGEGKRLFEVESLLPFFCFCWRPSLEAMARAVTEKDALAFVGNALCVRSGRCQNAKQARLPASSARCCTL
jgi:hypothetical protein